MRKALKVSYNIEAMAEFRRRAERTDKEILAWMVGRSYRNKEFWIEDLVYPKIRNGRGWVEELHGQQIPKGYLGTLHSHPNNRYIGCSRLDLQTSWEDEEKIFGIYTYHKKGKPKVNSFNFYRVDSFVTLVKGY